MSKELLFKKLTILTGKEIPVNDNISFKSLFYKGKLTLIKGTICENRFQEIDLTKEYLSSKREVYTGRPEKSYTDNWCTYKGCTSGILSFDGKDINLSLVLREGNSCDGWPENKRWQGDFKVEKSILYLFEDYIDCQFEIEVDHQFRMEEQMRVSKMKDGIRSRLLKSNNELNIS